MAAYRLPGPTCGENQLLVVDDGTSSRWPSSRPGTLNGAEPAHSSELDPYTLVQRARGVCDALVQARPFVPAAVYRETLVELGQVLDGLLPALMMAIGALGASALLGGAIGALVGALAGGVGAVPGAVIGAGAGMDIGVALLTWAGLAFLIEPVVHSLGALSSQISSATRRAWDAYGRPDRDTEVLAAARLYADAVAMLMRLILLAIVLRLTAGQAPVAAARAAGAAGRLGEGAAGASQATAEVVAQLRASRLGGGFADWVEAHSQELIDNPRLRPPRAEPATSARTAPASTPSQLRESAARQGGAASPRPAAEEVPISQQSNAAKGVFGEAKADAWMDPSKYEKLNGKLTQIGDPPRGPGIDGVWKVAKPPPEYIITEAKYGSSKLSTLKDGTKQMSDKWVRRNLSRAVGREANAIKKAMAREGQVEKWLLQVDEAGNVTKTPIR